MARLGQQVGHRAAGRSTDGSNRSQSRWGVWVRVAPAQAHRRRCRWTFPRPRALGPNTHDHQVVREPRRPSTALRPDAPSGRPTRSAKWTVLCPRLGRHGRATTRSATSAGSRVWARRRTTRQAFGGGLTWDHVVEVVVHHRRRGLHRSRSK
jgi:hypothetical protein